MLFGNLMVIFKEVLIYTLFLPGWICMHHIFSVVISLCLLFGSLCAASDKCAPLEWVNGPVEYEAGISPLLQERHSVRNIMIAASLGSLAKKCKVDLSVQNADTVLEKMATSMRGNLGAYLGKLAKDSDTAHKAHIEFITFVKRCMRTEAEIPASEKSRALFWECAGELCPVNRTKHPSARSFLEDKFIDAVAGRYTDVGTFFGSEFLAQEARVLERLHAAGKQIKQVNLIDTIYAETIKLLQQCRRASKIDIPTDRSLYAYMHNRDIYNRLQHTLCHCCGGFESPIFNLFDACLVAATLDQFKDYTHTLFPAMKLRIYGDVQTYIQDCKEQHALRSEFLVGSDVIDITSPWDKNSWNAFHAVQNNCLQMSAISALLSITKDCALLHSYATGVGQKRWTYDCAQQEWREMDEAEFNQHCQQADARESAEHEHQQHN